MPCASARAGAAYPSKGSQVSQEHGCSFSYPMFQKFQSMSNVFSGIAGLGGDVGLSLRDKGPTSFVQGELVSGEFFATLGIDAAVGRTLRPSDDTQGAAPVAELGYGYWQSAFGGDPNAVGKTIWLNSVPVTVVGVAAREFPDFNPASNAKLWVPLSLKPQLGRDLYGSLGGDHPSLDAGDDNWWVYVVGRLKPGIKQEAAQSEVDVLFRNDVAESKTLFKQEDAPRLSLVPAPEAITALRDRFSKPLTILMFAVCIVLLIACVNVAGLMLARSAARQRELALRLAVGAGRTRIVRQLLTESILLSVAGGVSGALLAYWTAHSLIAFMSHGGHWPAHLSAQLDLRVLAFTAGVSLLTGILFGLVPALRGVRVGVALALKESTTTSADGAARGRWLSLGGGLVVVQVALSIMVLAGAGLLVRTLENLKNTALGFDQRNVLLFGIDPTLNGYTDAQTRSLYSELQERLTALPGVRSASYSFDALLSGNLWSTSFRIEGQTQTKQEVANGLSVGPKFFETLGIPLVAGRTLRPEDFASAANSAWHPVVINQAFERRFFQNQNPLGRWIGGLEAKGVSFQIIGVVGDAKYQALRSETEPTIYIPQTSEGTMFEIRTAADPASMIPAVRSLVSQIDKNLPIFDVATQSEVIEQSIFQERLFARLSSFFGGLSLVLVCIGLYGLLSYEVTRRTHEIGIRLALGAQRGDVLRLVIRQGAILAVLGALIGIAAALAVTRYLQSFLFGVKPSDPVTIVAVAFGLIAVALLASYIPARRAMKTDPMVALRYE
jgi:predicted permease